MQINKEADFVLKGNKVIHPPVRTDGLELYYDTKGKKNTDTYKNRMLDMSGNDRHGELHGFNYKNLSGYQEDSELVFDGIDDTLKIPKLNGIDANNFTYQLNNNILAFTGEEFKTVKNGSVEVGRRNLIPQSNNFSEGHWDREQEENKEGHSSFRIAGGFTSYGPQIALEGNTQYVYSAYVLFDRDTSISATSPLHRHFIAKGQTSPQSGMKSAKLLSSGVVKANVWSRIEILIETSDSESVRMKTILYGIPTGTTSWWRNFQLEKGNKSTDWTPAPEDLIEATDLNGNILGDMEDIIDDHTRDEQSGLEVFTDKADDSLAMVEVDGKSYQYSGSGKNVFPYLINSQAVDVSGRAEVSEGKITLNEMGDRVRVMFPWDGRDSRIRIRADYSENGLINARYYNSEGAQIGTNGLTMSKGSKRLGIIPYSLSQGDLRNARYIELDFTTHSTLAVSPYTVSNIMVTSTNDILTEYEPPAPTPDYPIEIHNLNNFDVVSSVGKRNLIHNEAMDYRHSISLDNWTSNQGSTYRSEKIDMFNEWGVNEAYKIITTAGESTTGTHRYVRGGMEHGKVYTYSIYFKNTSNFDLELHFNGFREPNTGSTISINNIKPNESKKISINGTRREDFDWFQIMPRTYSDNRGKEYSFIVANEKFEEGTIGTPWTPAPEDIAENDNHPLIDKINLSLSEPLRSVGDIKDKLFRDSDGLWKIERNVGEHVADKETQVTNSSFDYVHIHIDKNGLNDSSKQVYYKHSHAIFETTAARAITKGNFAISNTLNRYCFGRLEDVSTVEEIKSWLIQEYNKGTPLTLVYELEAPYLEILSQDLQDKLNNLRSFQDSNYVYTIINEADGLPSHISENLKPILDARFLAKDHFKESRTVNNLLIWNRPLEDEELLNQNKLFHERFNMRSNTIKDEPINQEINLIQGGYAANTLSLEYTIEI